MNTSLRALVIVVSLLAVAEAQAPPAAARMSDPGPQGQALERDVGKWTVVATFRPTPDAKPMVTEGLVAERTLVGLYLQEVMRPAPGSTTPDFQRIDYLTYNRVEGRWQYVSLDTRFPVGIMPAWSFADDGVRKISLVFEPIAFVGLGREVEGRMMRSDMVITRTDDDHQTKQQRWVAADGSGKSWVAVQYEYTRKR